MRRLLVIAALLLTACPAKPGDTAGAVDLDGDGFVSTQDCDDDNAAVFPGAVEHCNGYDDDCDGYVDDDDPSLDGLLDLSVDGDGDGWGSMDEAAQGSFCEDPGEGWVEDATDCDDTAPEVHPEAQEVCNQLDDDCDGAVDEEGALESSWYLDSDGDGYGDPAEVIEQCEQPSGYVLAAYGADCDDSDAAVFPGAEEHCNGYDDDCDGVVDEDDAVDGATWYADADGDGYGDPASTTTACSQPSGYTTDSSDCDDGDLAVSPGADEHCNGYDDDCDGVVDEDDAVDGATWYADADGDGYGDPASTTTACSQPSGYGSDSSDCDDTRDDSWPGADELCDGLDNDCDGTVDEEVVDGTTWYLDSDGDGYGDASSSSTTTTCERPTGYVADATDCDDGDASVNPWVDELCNGVDDDCDGTVDEATAIDAITWYADVDRDGYGDSASLIVACDQPTGWVADGTDCNDLDTATNPGASESCDGVDNDCDGAVDEDDAVDGATWYADADGDGYGDPASTTTACSQPSGYITDSSDCDDADGTINPGVSESCDGVDNDCDGTVDEDGAVDALTWYADADGDSYGDPTSTTTACSQPSGYVADATDCDDADATQYPGADEYCDLVDNDCDGTVDEATAIDAVTWYTDGDGDGYGDSSSTTVSCTRPSGSSATGGDCDDSDALVNPGRDELCDGVDNDCDGAVDEAGAVDGSAWYLDSDGDGYGDSASSTTACTAPSGYVSNSHDCDDSAASVYPLADEYCNGVDDDCDGTVDEDSAVDTSTWYQDVDGDGYGRSTFVISTCSAPSGFVADSTDCDDGDSSIHPGADEYCDIVDHDCDGSSTAGAVDGSTWYFDGDGDGYGDSGAATTACSRPSGSVALAGDCDDTDASISPAAAELCDGVDNDCDGTADGSGVATWYEASGSVTDVSSQMGSGTSYSAYARTINADGTLVLCPGTYYAHLSVGTADFTLTGLDGSGSTTLEGDGSTSVVYARSSAATISIEGLTIRGGSASYGGGIFGGTHGLDLELDDVVVEDCYASSPGGGVYIYDGTLIASDMVLDGNESGSYGGGICTYGTDVYIDGLVITDNECSSYGGGAYFREGDVEILDATIEDNTAAYAGGLIAHTCEFTLSDSEVTGNDAYYFGGGVYLTYGEAELDEVRVHGNAATHGSWSYPPVGGGLFLNNGVEVTCTGTTSTTAGVYDNEADYGAGAFVYDAYSELDSNTCDWGSGGDDNDPDDVALTYGFTWYTSYGDDASFTCSGYSCY